MSKRPTVGLSAVTAFVLLWLVGCGGDADPENTENAAPAGDDMTLTSAAFAAGEMIPVVYTCDGDDISPPLAWDQPPEGTAGLALIMDDPDAPAGVWDHWLIYNLPPETAELPENVAGDLPGEARYGRNSWGRNDYGGPCPPGGTHNYVFKLYALDTALALSAEADKDGLLAAMEGHILARGELVGRYGR